MSLRQLFCNTLNIVNRGNFERERKKKLKTNNFVSINIILTSDLSSLYLF